MRDEDMAVCDAPAETDAETGGIAGDGEVGLVIDEVVEGVVCEGGLDCCDCVGDVVGFY
jgi:hypothetical protein